MKYWFVNQGTSYDEERKDGYLYAPAKNEKGTTLTHWSNVKHVKKGDIIFCNKKGYIISVAKALSDGYDSVIPDNIKGLWYSKGFKVDIEYIDLKNKFRFNEYKDKYMENLNPQENPFDSNGNAKMGYLFPIERENAHLFLDAMHDNNVLSFINKDKTSVINEMIELQEEEQQFDDISSGLIKSYSEEELKIVENKEYKYVPRYDKKNRVLREKTDAKLKATRLELANYKCEINPNHNTFTNSSGKHQYLECHHIIPINAQKDFPNIKLDNMFNIIALCPNCHMEVHHAFKDERRKIFKKMYNLRKEEMIKHGFDEVKIEEVFKKYYLNK